MDPVGLHHRPATRADREPLATFACSSADARVEPWVRERALQRCLAATPADDFRLLLFHDDLGELVAVTAHERNDRVADAEGDVLPGSYLVLVAISDRFRDSRAPEGRPLINPILESTVDDIRSRNRGRLVTMMVHPGNDDGAKVVTRLGANRLGTSGEDEVYVMEIEK